MYHNLRRLWNGNIPIFKEKGTAKMKNTIYGLLTVLGVWIFTTANNTVVTAIIILVILGFFIKEFARTFKDICKLLQAERGDE